MNEIRKPKKKISDIATSLATLFILLCIIFGFFAACIILLKVVFF